MDTDTRQYRFCAHMTDEMRACLVGIEALMAEAVACHRAARAAHAARSIRLPAVAANGGPVVVGALNVMDDIVSYWIVRRDAAVRMLPREREMDAWADRMGFSTVVFGKLGAPAPEDG